MRSLPPNKRSYTRKPRPVVFTSARMENHVRLQQSQQEFLEWLEASEKSSPDLDRYNYKKIR